MYFLLLFYLIQLFLTIKSEILYLGGLSENEDCPFPDGSFGSCKTFSECPSEFENYKFNNSLLTICKYRDSRSVDLFCCRKIIESEKSQILDRIDSEICSVSFSLTQKGFRNSADLKEKIKLKQNITEEDCENIRKYGTNDLKSVNYFLKNEKMFRNYEITDTIDYSCNNQMLFFTDSIMVGQLVKKGDRSNMAALGWTQNDGSIKFGCGGSILSSRWIISASHCKFYKGKIVDILRVGDRFLKTPQDDENSQQIKVEKFIHHPDYKSSKFYHDIAMIKTQEEIIFNDFVSHSCISTQNSHNDVKLSVSGFGNTENDTDGVLLEIDVSLVDQEKCSKKYSDRNFQSRLPEGISSGHICIGALSNHPYYTPDTCQGDSGSPLQYYEEYSVYDSNYSQTFMKTTFKIPMVVGIVSFGVGCGTRFPSVYTYVPYYTDWIRSVMN